MIGSRLTRVVCLSVCFASIGLAAACSSSDSGGTDGGSDASEPIDSSVTSDTGTTADGGTAPDQGMPLDTGVDAGVDSQVPGEASAADGSSSDAPPGDAPLVDASPADASPVDASPGDASPVDASPADASPVDASPVDASPADASPVDASPADASPIDASPVDASPADASPPVDSSAGTEAGDAASVTHPVDPPQVVDAGGPVLASPKIVGVFFSNDDSTVVTQLTSFTRGLGSSAYFAATTAEYGVGAGPNTPPVNLTEPAPNNIDDSTIQTWLAGKLNANDALWPAPDANTVYVLYYPAMTTVTFATETGCQGFSGYHNEISLDVAHGNRNVAYVVMPRCSSVAALTGIDAVTGPASAHIAEAVTDPYPSMNPAYTSLDQAHLDWETIVGGGEVGAMCTLASSLYLKPTGFAYTVQRIWSNASIKASHDPCLPLAPGEVYFNSEPLLPGTVHVGSRNELGVQIAVGGSATVPLALYSDGATGGPWTVSAIDNRQFQGNSAELVFSFDKTQGQAGDTIHMTIHVPAALTGGHDTFIVISRLGQQTSYWMGEVTN